MGKKKSAAIYSSFCVGDANFFDFFSLSLNTVNRRTMSCNQLKKYIYYSCATVQEQLFSASFLTAQLEIWSHHCFVLKTFFIPVFFMGLCLAFFPSQRPSWSLSLGIVIFCLKRFFFEQIKFFFLSCFSSYMVSIICPHVVQLVCNLDPPSR